MILIPIVLWEDQPQITTALFTWMSLIPTLIRNLIGVGVFMGAAYWYLYLTGKNAIDVDFNLGSLSTALGAGSPDRKV